MQIIHMEGVCDGNGDRKVYGLLIALIQPLISALVTQRKGVK
jgi:hypothetical protein